MIGQRIATAAALAIILIGAILVLPVPVFVVLLGVVFLGGFWEWAGFFGHAFGPRRLPFVAVGAVALALTYFYVFVQASSPLPFLLVAAIWWVVALVWIVRYPTPVPRWAIRSCAFVVLVPAWLGLSLLLSRTGNGALWLLAAFVLVWAADTGAYFCGRTFGRHKLAPRVSPGKTWEGVLGGVVLAAAVAAVGAPYLHVSPWLMSAATVPIVLASVVGDLIVSLFKRNAGLKDSGRLFPGHGGFLDRLDSICAAAPLLALGLIVTEAG